MKYALLLIMLLPSLSFAEETSKVQPLRSQSAIFDEVEKMHRSMLKISKLVNEDLEYELDEFNKIRRQNQKNNEDYSSHFENFDQKANQLYNILSTVMKSMKEMQSSVTRNTL